MECAFAPAAALESGVLRECWTPVTACVERDHTHSPGPPGSPATMKPRRQRAATAYPASVRRLAPWDPASGADRRATAAERKVVADELCQRGADAKFAARAAAHVDCWYGPLPDGGGDGWWYSVNGACLKAYKGLLGHARGEKQWFYADREAMVDVLVAQALRCG